MSISLSHFHLNNISDIIYHFACHQPAQRHGEIAIRHRVTAQSEVLVARKRAEDEARFLQQLAAWDRNGSGLVAEAAVSRVLRELEPELEEEEIREALDAARDSCYTEDGGAAALWRRVSWVVQKSTAEGVLDAAAAMTQRRLRIAIFRFFLTPQNVAPHGFYYVRLVKEHLL